MCPGCVSCQIPSWLLMGQPNTELCLRLSTSPPRHLQCQELWDQESGDLVSSLISITLLLKVVESQASTVLRRCMPASRMGHVRVEEGRMGACACRGKVRGQVRAGFKTPWDSSREDGETSFSNMTMSITVPCCLFI